MPSEDLKIECCDEGVLTLRVGIVSAKGLETLVSAMQEMATGRASNLRLHEMEGVRTVRGVRVFLEHVDDDPKLTINKYITGHQVKRGLDPWFFWRRSSEGWRRCAELAGALAPGKHQNFSGDGDEVPLEVTYWE